jgi:hypothetical protein
VGRLRSALVKQMMVRLGTCMRMMMMILMIRVGIITMEERLLRMMAVTMVVTRMIMTLVLDIIAQAPHHFHGKILTGSKIASLIPPVINTLNSGEVCGCLVFVMIG